MQHKRPRILLVDDDAALVRMMRLTFLTEGFDTMSASDGLEALDRLSLAPVDAVVLDLQMPRLDGRGFYRELRARGDLTPVVILSAYGAAEAMNELKANAYVRKPFDPADLIAAVRGLLPSGDPSSN